MYRSDLLRLGLCTGVSILAIAPFLATSVHAFPGGGFSHGGGGGISGGGFSRGISGGIPGGFSHGIGGAAPMIRSAPIGAGGGLHSLSGMGAVHTYTGPQTYSIPHSTTFAIRHSGGPSTFSRQGDDPLAGRIGHNLPDGALSQPNVRNHLNGQLANNHLANLENQNWATRSLHGVGQASVLRNGAFASLAQHNTITRSLASTTFRGRFAGQNWKLANGGWFWRHRHPIIAIGWFGPLFWPYAYDDFIDYTFWPYAYDVFWPYVYDDLYVGVFGPYSYEGPASGSSTSSRRATASRSAAAARVCREQAPALTGWPIQQIAQTVQPDQAQQAALDGLKEAAGKALDLLQSACPNELPSTPTGRLSAMHKRIEVMSQALAIVQPALGGFYDLLSDEQKSRFNAITPQARPASTARGSKQLPDLARVCSGQAAKPTNAPTERIEQVVNPTDSQRVSLQALNDASAKAADYLKANCSAEEALTPPGRVAAMAQRLNAMLEAIKIVQPALESFYGGLTDEQKARFNQLGAPQS
jgi:hypothetical protein